MVIRGPMGVYYVGSSGFRVQEVHVVDFAVWVWIELGSSIFDCILGIDGALVRCYIGAVAVFQIWVCQVELTESPSISFQVGVAVAYA
eukprot:snap_masked-scaffold_19-processed-gene-4.24-mRNA-1 protein AED:1.00 eAED:1.00 QI:0/0/0/0/1/1/2/0/87